MKPPLSTHITFHDYHKPVLRSGEYRVSARQNFIITSKSVNDNQEITKSFFVGGERFTIDPKEIAAVYPGENSASDHSNVLPHVVLTRSTLPWERLANAHDEEHELAHDALLPNGARPWLGILLVSEDEFTDITESIITLSDLKKTTDPNVEGQKSNIYFDDIELRPGQKPDDKVSVVDIKKSLANIIIPKENELPFLAHVRQGTDKDGQLEGSELAIVIGNRLPKKNSLNKAFLVSFEERYDDSGFQFHGATDEHYIRFVVFKSWTFECPDIGKNFHEVIEDLNHNPSALRLPNHIKKEDNPTVHDHLERFLSRGCVSAPHFLRWGKKTVSWYHGPFIPFDDFDNRIESAPHAISDDLLIYHKSLDMFDVTYAAAWELGRLLALQNKPFSTKLYQWKRSLLQLSAHISEDVSHLPIKPDFNTVTPPAIVTDFLDDLIHVKGIPFHYLIPDEALLPPESIRFFHLDSNWIEAILDGAISIGRVNKKQKDFDAQIIRPKLPHSYNKPVTGMIIRSSAVADWPGMQIDGYDHPHPQPNDSPLHYFSEPIHLSKNVLLVLFDGLVKAVDIHLKAEMIHFGFSEDAGDHYTKLLRDHDGKDLTINDANKVSVPFRDLAKRVVAINHNDGINGLVDEIGTKYRSNNSIGWYIPASSTVFAIQAIQGVDAVRFTYQ